MVSLSTFHFTYKVLEKYGICTMTHVPLGYSSGGINGPEVELGLINGSIVVKLISNITVKRSQGVISAVKTGVKQLYILQ